MPKNESYKTDSLAALVPEVQEEIKSLAVKHFGPEGAPENMHVYYTIHQTPDGEWAIMMQTSQSVSDTSSPDEIVIKLNESGQEYMKKLWNEE